jgi:hypothetical protein
VTLGDSLQGRTVEYDYRRVPRFRGRYWQRRWDSMSARKRAELSHGTMVEYSVDVEELCGKISSIPAMPFKELLATLQRELASRS